MCDCDVSLAHWRRVRSAPELGLSIFLMVSGLVLFSDALFGFFGLFALNNVLYVTIISAMIVGIGMIGFARSTSFRGPHYVCYRRDDVVHFHVGQKYGLSTTEANNIGLPYFVGRVGFFRTEARVLGPAAPWRVWFIPGRKPSTLMDMSSQNPSFQLIDEFECGFIDTPRRALEIVNRAESAAAFHHEYEFNIKRLRCILGKILLSIDAQYCDPKSGGSRSKPAMQFRRRLMHVLEPLWDEFDEMTALVGIDGTKRLSPEILKAWYTEAALGD